MPWLTLLAVFQALPFIFMKTRGFTIGQSGLIFIGVGIGTTFGSIINHLCSLHYPKLVKKWRGFPPPEERLFGAMIGAPALVIGGFWLGWTGEYSHIHWAVPAMATVFIGMGISLIFISFFVSTSQWFAAALLANPVDRASSWIPICKLPPTFTQIDRHANTPLQDVCCLCFLCQYRRPVTGGSCIPAIHYPDVPERACPLATCSIRYQN